MAYTVIEAFRDLRDDGHVYRAGDAFPRDGVTVDKARLDELAGDTNRMGRPLIKAVKPARKRERKRET